MRVARLKTVLSQNTAADEAVRFRLLPKIVGIDPGANTGVALYDRASKTILEAKTLDFWRAFDFVCAFSKDEIAVIVEDPGLNRPTFREHGNAYRENISQKVGGNKAEARLMIEGLRRMGYLVRTVKPNTAKWTIDQVKRNTGYTGKTSEHSRDAIKLCCGY